MPRAKKLFENRCTGCDRATHNLGGKCTNCLNRNTIKPRSQQVPQRGAAIEAERRSRQPGVRVDLDWRGMKEVG